MKSSWSGSRKTIGTSMMKRSEVLVLRGEGVTSDGKDKDNLSLIENWQNYHKAGC